MPKEKVQKEEKPTDVETKRGPSFTVGLSINRPLDAQENDIYYEIDTGNRIRFTLSGWTKIDTLEV